MPNALEFIHDQFEESGLHFICTNGNEVLGTGRLNIIDGLGVISQMAIKLENQKQGIGRRILTELIQKCKAKSLQKIELSARETAIRFYEKFGFIPVGNKYPSTKTGIVHQKMVFM